MHSLASARVGEMATAKGMGMETATESEWALVLELDLDLRQGETTEVASPARGCPSSKPGGYQLPR